MLSSLTSIDKYVQIHDQLAISGQPSLRQFNLLRQIGVQLVIHLQIKEVEPVIRNEYSVVTNQGMMYENIPVSFNEPQYTTYQQFVTVLEDYARFNIWVHCTVGYCTSGFLVPYLVREHGMTLENAIQKMTVTQFAPQWDTLIDNILSDNYAIT